MIGYKGGFEDEKLTGYLTVGLAIFSAEKEHEIQPPRSPLRFRDQLAAALVGFISFSFSVLKMVDGHLKTTLEFTKMSIVASTQETSRKRIAFLHF